MDDAVIVLLRREIGLELLGAERRETGEAKAAVVEEDKEGLEEIGNLAEAPDALRALTLDEEGNEAAFARGRADNGRSFYFCLCLPRNSDPLCRSFCRLRFKGRKVGLPHF